MTGTAMDGDAKDGYVLYPLEVSGSDTSMTEIIQCYM